MDKSNNRKILLILLGLVFFTGIFLRGNAQEHVSEVKKGKVLFERSNFNSGFKKLNGEWEFYPYQLFKPIDFNLKDISDKRIFVDVPLAWNSYQVHDKDFSQDGFGTFRVIVVHNCAREHLALYVGDIATASKLFIDGNQLIELGSVGNTNLRSKPNFKSIIVPFEPKTDTSEIVIQVSNYHYARGGILEEIKIGKETEVREYHTTKNEIDLFLIGSIFIMALYHLGLFILRRKNRSTLFFSIICFLISLRITLTGELYFLKLFPDFDWTWRIRLEYSTFYLAPISFVLFAFFIFRKVFNKIFIYLIIAITVVFNVFLLFPVCFFTATLPYFQLFTLLICIYLLIILIKAVRKKERGAKTFIAGFLVFACSVVNDILYVNNIIETIELVQFGLFVFIFSQAYLLSARFTDAFVKTEELSSELNDLNRDLEHKVEIRTKEISEKNHVLEQQKDEMLQINTVLEQQKEEITQQRDEITSQHQVVVKQKREITDSIFYAQRIQRAILPPDDFFKNVFSEYFVMFMPKNIVSGDFYWGEIVEEKTIIAVADCTGHGVPGGFMSMLGSAFLNELVLKNEFTKASDILEGLRNKVKISLRQTGKAHELKDGMDIALLIIDNKTKELQYAGANNHLYVVCEKSCNIIKKAKNKVISNDKHKLVQVKADRQPIAVYLKERPFTNHYLQLCKDDKIYLFTDGYGDQIGGDKNRKFMVKRLKEKILDISEVSFTKQHRILNQTFEDWKSTNNQLDDILVLGFKI